MTTVGRERNRAEITRRKSRIAAHENRPRLIFARPVPQQDFSGLANRQGFAVGRKGDRRHFARTGLPGGDLRLRRDAQHVYLIFILPSGGTAIRGKRQATCNLTGHFPLQPFIAGGRIDQSERIGEFVSCFIDLPAADRQHPTVGRTGGGADGLRHRRVIRQLPAGKSVPVLQESVAGDLH